MVVVLGWNAPGSWCLNMGGRFLVLRWRRPFSSHDSLVSNCVLFLFI